MTMRSFEVSGRIIAVRASGQYAKTVERIDRAYEDARPTMPPAPGEPVTIADAVEEMRRWVGGEGR
jgi:hypothetical protein